MNKEIPADILKQIEDEADKWAQELPESMWNRPLSISDATGAFIEGAKFALSLSPSSGEGEPGDKAIRLKDLSITFQVWLNIYYNTVHNNQVIAETLYKKEEIVSADFFHTRETNIRLSKTMAEDLILRLLRQGIRVTFLDGSETEIKKLSPPLYDKWYNSQQISEATNTTEPGQGVKTAEETNKNHYEYKKRMEILREHLGDALFYDTGNMHNAIDDAMEQYRNQ